MRKHLANVAIGFLAGILMTQVAYALLSMAGW